MTELALDERPRAAQPGTRLDRVAAWSLLATIAVLTVCLVVLGEKRVSLGELRHDIATGDVTEVRLSEEFAPGSRGWSGVTIEWQRNGITHATWVVQASDEGQARRAKQHTPGPVVVGDVATALTTAGNEVTVVGRAGDGRGWSTAGLGFTAPGWIALTYLATVLGTLLLVGPREPWRATQWAWRWIVLLVPGGPVAFLLLGGPTGRFPPRIEHRRLTGGWAFLLASFLGAGLR